MTCPQYDDDEDDDDCGADCVVCMCDLRDTIILPCRHLCLCFACAESLRYQVWINLSLQDIPWAEFLAGQV